ncbi:MAG: ParB N-terminal domain-containing protein [Candidatus Omnitrophica bacterium]|nr:ParB N-terminal domain-containing protein [Candidatus Omnitrophota bacterium]
MSAQAQSELRKIKLPELDPFDARYCFRYSLQDNALIESVRHFGILSPILVFSHEKRYGLISGFKRFFAALKLKLDEIPALVISDSGFDKERIRLSLENNRNGIYTPLDQAVAIAKLTAVIGLSKETVREECMPYLGLTPSLKILDEYEKISRLSREILEAVYLGDVPFRGIADWADFSVKEQAVLWDQCLSRFHFTSSELTEFASLVRDVIAVSVEPIEKIFDLPEIRDLSGKKEKQKSQVLIEILKQLRYPKSYEIRKQFRDKLSRVKFKLPIQLLKSESMEEEGIELRIRLLNREGFEKVMEELKKKQEEIEGLL